MGRYFYNEIETEDWHLINQGIIVDDTSLQFMGRLVDLKYPAFSEIRKKLTLSLKRPNGLVWLGDLRKESDCLVVHSKFRFLGMKYRHIISEAKERENFKYNRNCVALIQNPELCSRQNSGN